jgi:aspartate racemase
VKTLGLLGGMSWESTVSYSQSLNRMVRDRLGGLHSAPLLIWSADFAPIAAMQAAGEWDQATALLVRAARALEQAGAQALMICANTMHKMADEVQAAVDVPLIHVADVTAAAIGRTACRRPLLLATRFTMEQAFYRDRLASQGLQAVIPDAPDRMELHRIIYEELVRGVFEPAAKQTILRMVDKADADGVIFGCTEIGLIIGQDDLALPAFDTTELHARAGVDFALGAQS